MLVNNDALFGTHLTSSLHLIGFLYVELCCLWTCIDKFLID